MGKFTKTGIRIVVSVIVLLGAITCNKKQKSEDSTGMAEESNVLKFDDTNKGVDAQFLVDAAEINLEEIKLGQLAQHNSSMSDINQLGEMMEKGHTKSLETLTELAKKKNITIPMSPSNSVLDTYEKLNNKSGIDFDKEYSQMMVDGHKNAIEKFEKASVELSDDDIRAWAKATLPDLNKHLEHSMVCYKKYNKI